MEAAPAVEAEEAIAAAEESAPVEAFEVNGQNLSLVEVAKGKKFLGRNAQNKSSSYVEKT